MFICLNLLIFCLIFIIVASVTIITLAFMKDVVGNSIINLKFIPKNTLIYNASTGNLVKSYIPSDFVQKNVLIDKVLIIKDLYISLIFLVCKYDYTITKDIYDIIKSAQDKYKSYLYELDLDDVSTPLIVKYEIVMYRSIHVFLKQKFGNFPLKENYDLNKIKSFLLKDYSSFIIKLDTVENAMNSLKDIRNIMFYFYVLKNYTKLTINIDMIDKFCRVIRQNIYNSWTGFISINDENTDALELILLHNLIVPNKEYILSPNIITSYNTIYANTPVKYELVLGNNTNDMLYFNKNINSLRYSFNGILIYCMYKNHNNGLKTHIDLNNMTSYFAKKMFNSDKKYLDEIIFKGDEINMDIGSFIYEYNKNIYLIGRCFKTNSYLITVINKNGIIVIRDYDLKNEFTYNLYVEYILNKYDNYPCFIQSKNTTEEYVEKNAIFDIRKVSLLPIIINDKNKLFESYIGFNNKSINYLYDNEKKIFIIDDISFSLNPNLSSLNIIPKDAKVIKVSLKDTDLYYDVSISDNNKLISINNVKSNIDRNECNFIMYHK